MTHLLLAQIFYPLGWERDPIQFEPFETYGECRIDKSEINTDKYQPATLFTVYVIPLLCLFVVIMVMTAVTAWRLKDVQADLSDAKWVFFGILSHIQIWAIGVPVIIITDGVSKDASYIMLSAVTSMLSNSMVTFVIGQKVYTWIQEEYFGGPAKTTHINLRKGSNTRVSGLSNDHNSTPTSQGASTGASVDTQVRLSAVDSGDDNNGDSNEPANNS